LKNTPERIVLEAFADELEKVGGQMEKLALFGLGAKTVGAAAKKPGFLGRVGKGLKGWFGPLSLGITAILAPFTMKRFANTAIKGPEKLRPPSFSPGRPRGGFHG